MKATGRPSLVVSTDGRGVVSHAGSRLLANLADRVTLTAELSAGLAGLSRPRAVHDPGQVLVDLAVADGAECICDIAVLADQPGLFGAVASDSTVWRLLDRLDEAELAAVAVARAAAREVVWAQRGEMTGAPVPAATAAGVELPGLVIDVDASIVECHSEKESAAATFKSSFGYHPILVFLDNSGEFLAGLLRPGNAGANTAADHITVLDQALAQIPDAHRHGSPILVRADGAGCPAPTRPLTQPTTPTTGAGEPGEPGRETNHAPAAPPEETRSTAASGSLMNDRGRCFSCLSGASTLDTRDSGSRESALVRAWA